MFVQYGGRHEELATDLVGVRYSVFGIRCSMFDDVSLEGTRLPNEVLYFLLLRLKPAVGKSNNNRIQFATV